MPLSPAPSQKDFLQSKIILKFLPDDSGGGGGGGGSDDDDDEREGEEGSEKGGIRRKATYNGHHLFNTYYVAGTS